MASTYTPAAVSGSSRWRKSSLDPVNPGTSRAAATAGRSGRASIAASGPSGRGRSTRRAQRGSSVERGVDTLRSEGLCGVVPAWLLLRRRSLDHGLRRRRLAAAGRPDAGAARVRDRVRAEILGRLGSGVGRGGDGLGGGLAGPGPLARLGLLRRRLSGLGLQSIGHVSIRHRRARLDLRRGGLAGPGALARLGLLRRLPDQRFGRLTEHRLGHSGRLRLAHRPDRAGKRAGGQLDAATARRRLARAGPLARRPLRAHSRFGRRYRRDRGGRVIGAARHALDSLADHRGRRAVTGGLDLLAATGPGALPGRARGALLLGRLLAAPLAASGRAAAAGLPEILDLLGLKALAHPLLPRQYTLDALGDAEVPVELRRGGVKLSGLGEL